MQLIRVSLFFLIASVSGALSSSVSADGPRLRVPQRFKQLYKQGNVTVEFYDSVAEPMEYPGNSAFQLKVRIRFLHEYRFIVRGSKRYVRIKPRIQEFSWNIQNTVKIPESHNTAGLWNGILMLHELDHVALSSDPRTKMLLEHLLYSIKVIEKPVPRRGKIETSVIQKMVEEELFARRDALVELIQKKNVHLDKITKHGVRPIADRDAFFESLYTKEGLDASEFPFLGEVLDLLDQKKYKTAKRLHHSGPMENDDSSELIR